MPTPTGSTTINWLWEMQQMCAVVIGWEATHVICISMILAPHPGKVSNQQEPLIYTLNIRKKTSLLLES